MRNIGKFFPAFLIGLLVAVIIYAVLCVLELQQNSTDTKNALHQQNLKMNKVVEDFHALKNSDLQLRASIQDAIYRIDSLQASLGEQQNKYESLSLELSYLKNIVAEKMDESAIETSVRPLPFSYFLRPPWEVKVSNLKTKLRELGVLGTTFDGGGGEDTYIHPSSGNMPIDGFIGVSVEIYKLDNKVPNIIAVLAPGLLHLENDALTIYADQDIDQINLDGCLVWESKNSDKEFKHWSAVDINGEVRTVKIVKNVTTKIQPKCDNRYLDKYNIKTLQSPTDHPQLQSNSPSLQPSTFGGIGIKTKASENNFSGLEILNVLPGKPAQRAGLKAMDTIIKIDGLPVSDMSGIEAISKMRGQIGTEVRVTYIPRGLTADKMKEVVLIRELIDRSSERTEH